MAEITVKVTKYADRQFWIMYYDDPLSGKRITRSTKEKTEKAALTKAGEWQGQLVDGRYKPSATILWPDFRRRYEDEVLPSLAKKSGCLVATAFNAVERLCNPKKLRELNEDRLSYFQSELRKSLAESTIRTYLAHLSSALKWATRMKMLPSVPHVATPRRAKGSKMMKGRPIAGEEFDRLIAKVEAGLLAINSRNPKRKSTGKRKPSDQAAMARRIRQSELAAAVAPSWRYLLEGLWLSGLRLGESLDLHWTGDAGITVDLSGRRPMLRIPAECQKGNRDELWPLTPDFAEFLLRTPEADRKGPVFRPLGVRGDECRQLDWASAVISAIGKAAGIKVSTDQRSGRIKYASAHDLRRSFGARWAPRVMPAVLQKMMRHESIETTLRYYVGQNAEATADAIWSAAERVNTFVNSRPSEPENQNGHEVGNSMAAKTSN